jgi:ribosomal protein S18 acetylase RimI-like enzyme
MAIAPKERLRIRPLTAAELRGMVDLWRRSKLSYRPKGRDGMRALLSQREMAPELFIGAFLGGRLVGSVIASDDGRRGWINRLAVLPDARRMGVAKALIEAAENALRKRGRHLFCTHVESDNDPSMRLFEKAGYNRENEIIYYTKREWKSY